MIVHIDGVDIIGPITAVVDPVTKQFCADGMASGRIVVTVPRNPDPRTEQYSGNPANPIQAKP